MSIVIKNLYVDSADCFREVNMKNDQPSDWLPIVQKTVESLDFGVVQIVVHSSKVVQIELTEKIRFDLQTGQNRTLVKKEI